MWALRSLDIPKQDIKYGLRVLLKNPGFTAVAVLSLALGTGACTAIFSIVDAVLLRSLPYAEPSRLVQVREVDSKGSQMAVAEPNFLDLHARNRSLEAVAQYNGSLATVVGASQPVRTNVLWASTDFFRVFGVEPFAGRAFEPEEAGAPRAVAVVSYGFWQRLLGASHDLTGMTLRVNDLTCTVIGVMPPGFNFPQETEIWVPRELLPAQTSRSAHNWSVIARLRKDVSMEQAGADASAIGHQIKQEYGKDADAGDFALIPLQEYLVGNVRQGLLIVFVAVGFLLLVACMNVANLLLAQVTARQKELALRAALGASRMRLARQFITENVLLTLAAGALGLSLVIAVILGILPVLRLSDKDLQSDLKEAGRGLSAHAASKRLRGLLVISQVAFTLILLVGAGLLGKSFLRLLQVDPGFRVESTFVMDLSVPVAADEQRMKQLMQFFNQLQEGRAPTVEPPVDEARQRRQALFYQQLLEGISQLRGVTAAGGIDGLPMTGRTSNGTFWIENNLAMTGNAEYRRATEGYFITMGIPLLRGRLFDSSDRPESPPVAVISQSLAQKVWPNEDPVGKRIQFGNMDGDIRLIRIVGIVGDVRERGLDSDIRPTVYAYGLQRPPSSSLSIVIRAEGDTALLAPQLRQLVADLNPELPTNFRTLEQIFSSSLDNRRFSLVIFAVFAAVALMLAAVGIYGVVSYSVTQRTHEIGVRMALGAQSRDVLGMIVGQGLKLALFGVGLGVIASFALTRLMSSLLYGVSANDPVTFGVTSLLLVGVALLACYIPGRRATKVDPITALRHE